jgi:hypothetical protein
MTFSTFTGLDPQAPRPDRFRVGDVWSYEGRQYRVRRGVGEGLACLQPLGGRGSRLHLRRDSVARFLRVSWGGQP